MEKEKILDKMRELRDVRDLQILSKELENINLDVDYKKDLAENKVLILYILNQLDSGMIEDGLYKIIASINDVNYFYFKEVLTDLLDSKLVGIFTKDEEESVLRITTEGKNALSLTQDILPGLLKLKADNVFKKELLKLL